MGKGESVNGCVHFVDERHHIGGIVGIALGQMQAEEESRPHLGNDAWLFAKLSGTVTLSFFNRCNRDIVGIDDLAVRQGFSIDQPSRLFFDGLMGLYRLLQLVFQTPFLLRFERGITLETHLERKGKGNDLGTHRKQVFFSVSHQLDIHFSLSPARSPEGSHLLFKRLLETLRFLLDDTTACD